MGPSAAPAEEQALEGCCMWAHSLCLSLAVVLSHGAFVLWVFLSEDMGHTKAYIVVLEKLKLAFCR